MSSLLGAKSPVRNRQVHTRYVEPCEALTNHTLSSPQIRIRRALDRVVPLLQYPYHSTGNINMYRTGLDCLQHGLILSRSGRVKRREKTCGIPMPRSRVDRSFESAEAPSSVVVMPLAPGWAIEELESIWSPAVSTWSYSRYWRYIRYEQIKGKLRSSHWPRVV